MYDGVLRRDDADFRYLHEPSDLRRHDVVAILEAEAQCNTSGLEMSG